MRPGRDGDRWSLYERHHRAIATYLARRVEYDAVEDLVAETFAIAWRKLPRHADDPLAWLYGVARKVAHTHRRSHARRQALIRRLASFGHAGQAAPDPAESLPDDPRLARAFATLTAKEREALRLVAWERLDRERAARVAGCSPGTFAVRLSRARARLAKALETESAPHAAIDLAPESNA